MGRINVLDKHTAELIAAGEVVERPASVIKELVENSIDAGSKSITVEIMRGGVSYIRVTDDGCGIMKEDIRNAFVRHATSKVATEDDLASISTLGFRGEALASVSAVAKVELLTLSDNEEIGTRFVIHGGEEIEFDSAGCPQGTTIIVRDIFYNVPARMKFLKKDVSEGNAVTAIIDKIALSHPEVAFTYIRDGKQALKTTGDGKLLSAVYAVFGRDFAKGLIPVDYSLGGVSVSGYISQPYNARPNRNMQNFFINNRYVRCRTAMVALEEACKGSVMVGKFPACVLQISLSFEGVDVNVHPAKTEIRFINERPVFDAVYHGVKSALNTNHREKEVTLKSSQPNEKTVYNASGQKTPFSFDSLKLIYQKQSNTQNLTAQGQNSSVSSQPIVSVPRTSSYSQPHRLSDSTSDRESVEAYLNMLDNANIIVNQTSVGTEKNDADNSRNADKLRQGSIGNSTEEIKTEECKSEDIPVAQAEISLTQEEIDSSNPITEIAKPAVRYIGEVFNTYILAQRGDKEMLIIDKHAAHERIIYERLKQEKGTAYSQTLLEPVSVLLSSGEYDAVTNNIEAFTRLGFEIDEFGSSTVLVRAYPQYLKIEDLKSTVEEMAGYLLDNKKLIESEKMDWVYHNVACRAAIKGGNINNEAELKEILRIVENDERIRYCPHGRPVCTVIKKSEFEKMFGRV
ncbi:MULTISPECIES: DNA mismatch repair endonuclease MutL [unclassified Ruminococcus]|uniref:DNA mismatch repair endonuclease MutL n=1 Tax=unclassified Ruminococcus TaxID=2608920 RepID=UPI00210E60D8|nr:MULTISPECIES: DNA mismatch repair endonuclease MutL [unclassified Ruminococcus]MCQ4023142.1 DNA mismatch repair endonuclease MutL [Ruminococcus sp. zg-924]MCQ4115087.1 DNA mismatch repair endonuclease MutL [Ruminococcus sp. zg-921]